MTACLTTYAKTNPPVAGYAESPQATDGRFRNPIPKPITGVRGTAKAIWNVLFNKPKNATPQAPIPVDRLTRAQLDAAPDRSLFRLGHSTLLLKLNGGFWITDPVFAERASPVQWAGPKRFHAPPIALEDLPPLRGVILSHDHFDHLDRATVLTLAKTTYVFLTPLGVGDRLTAWGIDASKVRQFDWWQGTNIDGIQFTATPAQHFSGRSLFDSNKTLWASWVIVDASAPTPLRLFFSGDTGYFDGFKEIGRHFGPFDVAFLETGAYDANWPYVHMQPEQTVQAHIDLRARWLMPIHNGTFDLAMHAWTDPFERVLAVATQRHLSVATPRMGERLDLAAPQPLTRWWRGVDTAAAVAMSTHEVPLVPPLPRIRSGAPLVTPHLARPNTMKGSIHSPALTAPLAALSLAALIAMSFTGSGCSRATGGAAAAPPPAEVSVARAVETNVRAWDEFTGRVSAVDSVELRPRVSGYVDRVVFSEGQMVRKDDLLVVIDPRPYQAQLAQAQAQLERARSDAHLARTQGKRAKALIDARVISREEYESRTAAQSSSDASVRAAQAAVDAARLNLQYTQIRSPITGRAGRAQATQGNLAQADVTVLTTVVSMDPMYIDFNVDEQTYLRFQTVARPGAAADPVRVGLANEAGYPHAGTLNFMDNQVDAGTGTIRVRAVVPNPDRALTPGLFARIQFQGGASFRAVLIDDKAVLTDQDRKYVYVVGADNTAQRRDIVIGGMVDGRRVVSSGLRTGDQVVVEGVQKIFFPGMPVKAAPVKAPAAPAVTAR